MKSQGITIFQGEIANRLRHFVPTFIESNFYKRLPRKPQKIFVGSMSEIAHWEKEWMENVLEKIRVSPQHIFQFLTKFHEVYLKYIFPENCWLGVTITKDIELCDVSFLQFAYRKYTNIKYICFEPLLRKIVCVGILEDFDWVIIGAETGNRKGKVIPEKEWVLYVIKYCDSHKIPIFIKDNLLKYYPKFEYIKEFPKK